MRRNALFLSLLLVISLVGTGCILLEPHRLKDFTGPSWEVPLSIPVVPHTRYAVGDWITDGDASDGGLGFRYELEEIAPEPLNFTAGVQLPETSISERFDLNLDGLHSLPELTLAQSALTLKIQNAPHVTGSLSVELIGLRDGQEVVRVKRGGLSLTTSDTHVIEVAEVVNAKPRPDTVRVEITVDLPEQRVEGSGQLSFAADLWVPLRIQINADGAAIQTAPAKVGLDEDMRSSLSNASLTDVELFLDVVNHTPFAFQIELAFSNHSDPMADTTAPRIELDVPNGVLYNNRVTTASETRVRVGLSQELQDVLAHEPLYVAAALRISNDEAPTEVIIAERDFLEFRGFAIVTVDINKNAENVDTVNEAR